jgi:hypothetical protein
MDRTDYLGMLARDAAENGVAAGWTAHFPGLNINDYLAKTRLT